MIKNLPSQVLPPSEEALSVHLRGLEEFVQSQRQFYCQILLYAVIAEG